LEDITKEWSVDLLVPTYPMEMSNVDSPKTASDIARPSKIKKIEEVHNLGSASVNIASILAKQGGDGTEVEQRKTRLHHLEMRRIPRRKGRFPP
jgi:hypothetical protein